MTSNNPTSTTKGNFKLSYSLENIRVFQGIFTRVLFQILLLISIIAPAISVEALPVITNTATASFTINGNNLNLSDSVQFTKDTVVAPTDTLELEKHSSVSSALIGETINYTLVVKNPNPRPLTNTTIKDTLPLGLIYLTNSAKFNNVFINSNDVSILGNELNINLDTIPANTSLTVTYQVTVSSNTPEGDAINKAIANSDTATSPQVQANVIISEPLVVTPWY